MCQRRTIARPLPVLTATALVAVAAALAQMQVDNRVNPQLYPANPTQTMAQNYRPNDYNVGYSVHYGTTRQIGLLPSEVRMAAQRSGALPSELLINAQRAGPLNPYGAVAYIPNQSTVQQLMRLPPPQLYNPAYNLSPTLNQSQVTSPGAGSVAYSGFSRPAGNVATPTQQLMTPQPTRTVSTVGPAGSSSDSVGSTALNSELNPPALSSPNLGYGSVYFSSINPPRSSP